MEVEDTVQIEEAVRSTVCPFEDPWAIKFWLVPTAAFQVSGVLPLEQVVVAPKVPSQIWKLVTLVRSTFACVVPVMAPEAAVMVAVPWPAPVADPLVVMVTTVASEVDQQTVLPLQLVPPVRVDVLPSWKVPVAVICWVAPWLIVGVGGSIVMVLRVGF